MQWISPADQKWWLEFTKKEEEAKKADEAPAVPPAGGKVSSPPATTAARGGTGRGGAAAGRGKGAQPSSSSTATQAKGDKSKHVCVPRPGASDKLKFYHFFNIQLFCSTARYNWIILAFSFPLLIYHFNCIQYTDTSLSGKSKIYMYYKFLPPLTLKTDGHDTALYMI